MNDRFHKRSVFSGLPPLRAIGLLILMGFVLFISFRIFTAPTKVAQVITSPDGSREARLLHVFYYSEPGYKVAVRKGYLWHTLFYLPEYSEVPAEDRIEKLTWSPDSKRLTFEVNGTRVWGYDFPAQSSRLKSP